MGEQVDEAFTYILDALTIVCDVAMRDSRVALRSFVLSSSVEGKRYGSSEERRLQSKYFS